MSRINAVGLGFAFVLFLFLGSYPGDSTPSAFPEPESPILEDLDFAPPKHVPGEVLVKFRKNVAAVDKTRIHAETDAEVLSEIPALGVQKVRSKRGESAEVLIKRYRKNPRVEYAEPNWILRALLIPNDPRFPELHGLHNIGQTGGVPDADIDAPEAWDLETGNLNVIVSVIDSGVDYTHEDLKSRIWRNPGEIPENGLDDDGNGFSDDVLGWDFVNNDNDPMDDHGHGTHVAGTVAAEGDNGLGIVGAAWRTTILPLKFLNAGGEGPTDAAIQAILYASAMGARVSGNSWGCMGAGCFSQALEDAIRLAGQRGMLFVASAGNLGINNDRITTYPCTSAAPNVLCVAATAPDDRKAGFSNYGASTVDLGAPGVGILSTVPTGGCLLCDVSGYRYLQGTSMATPHAVGAAALLLARFSDLTAEELRSALMGTADPVAALDGITLTGGRLNADNALRARFVITLAPADRNVASGPLVTFVAAVRSLNDFSGPVGLSVAPLDPNPVGSFSVNPVILPVNGTAASTLSISVVPEMTAGSHPLTVIGAEASGEAHRAWARFTLLTDLVMADIAPLASEVNAGAVLSVTDTVVNRGGFSAGGFTVSYRLSTNRTYGDGDDISIASTRSVVSIASGETDTATTGLPIQATAAAGSYYLCAGVDSGNAVPESDELNTLCSSTRVLIPPPDLIVSALSTTATGILPGGYFSLSHTVANQGGSTARVSSLSFHLSANTVYGDTDDIPFTLTRTIPSLTAGKTAGASTTLGIPSATPAGSYHICAMTDSALAVKEGNEENNTACTASVIEVGRPDLVMSGVIPSTTSVKAGAALSVTDTVKNQGATAAGSFRIAYRLSPNAVYGDADDVILSTTRYVSSLAAGATHTAATSLAIPATIRGGLYHVCAKADSVGTVKEADEANNTVCSLSQVAVPPPDLVVTAVSTGSTTVRVGGSFFVSNTVKNIGGSAAGSFAVGFVLSSNTTLGDADDIVLSSQRSVTSLRVGASSATSTGLRVPSTAPPGAYYIGAVADANATVAEGNEANNGLVTAGTITVTP